MARSKWSEVEDRIVLAQRRAGASLEEIGGKLNRTKASVHNRLRILDGRRASKVAKKATHRAIVDRDVSPPKANGDRRRRLGSTPRASKVGGAPLSRLLGEAPRPVLPDPPAAIVIAVPLALASRHRADALDIAKTIVKTAALPGWRVTIDESEDAIAAAILSRRHRDPMTLVLDRHHGLVAESYCGSPVREAFLFVVRYVPREATIEEDRGADAE